MSRRFPLAIALMLAASSLAPAATAKRVLRAQDTGTNLLKPDAWGPWQKGFVREGDMFVCDNGDTPAHRGASQTVELNQTKPRPIVAVAWSKAEAVSPGGRGDYALYLDLVYTDGTPLWGQIAAFSPGAHDWERREVVVLPAKPVRTVAFHMLMRRRTGKAWFRAPKLYQVKPPRGSCMFDGIPVAVESKPFEGFAVRDVAANSDFVTFDASAQGRQALGLRLETKKTSKGGVTFVDAKLTDTTGKDRAVTLVYMVPVQGSDWTWLADPQRTQATEPPSEYSITSRFAAVGTTRLSKYPLAAVAQGKAGRAIGIDMGKPAVYRLAYAAGSRELLIAYDLGLAPEKPSAEVRLCYYDFDATWGFRAALQKYYDTFPDYFRCRTPEQGIWMPFAKISEVQGWEDFGFKFKEGDNETGWDDQHGFLTFRYTEPHTWWMRMSKDMPRDMETAIAYAKKLAAGKGHNAQRAKSFFNCAYYDENGQYCVRFRNTPWCNGAVWSVNSAPGVKGDVTDWKLAWNADYVAKHYGNQRKADLDGEYIDSSEGYVTAALDFRRGHFAAMQTPLTFGHNSKKPAAFRGLVVCEYVRTMAERIHSMGKLMMANSTPSRLCWLAPWLDVMGTETNWNRNGQWRPMTHRDLIYRRAVCGPKPFCFLMNTVFDEFPHERVELYMKRSLAYGMFPGFFSHNASEGHYFKRPNLYNRDRPLFKKYIPLCKLVAQAGWRPITLARSNDPKVLVERFGEKYLTVFNDAGKPRTAVVQLDGLRAAGARDLVRGRDIAIQGGTMRIPLEAEDVAVVELAR